MIFPVPYASLINNHKVSPSTSSVANMHCRAYHRCKFEAGFVLFVNEGTLGVMNQIIVGPRKKCGSVAAPFSASVSNKHFCTE
jgi:hypothetical protein